jgi:hypothetical protein
MKMPKKGNQDDSVYQIIDFDRALKVGTDGQDRLVRNTREIIRVWLTFQGKPEHDGLILNILFKEVDGEWRK